MQLAKMRDALDQRNSDRKRFCPDNNLVMYVGSSICILLAKNLMPKLYR